MIFPVNTLAEFFAWNSTCTYECNRELLTKHLDPLFEHMGFYTEWHAFENDTFYLNSAGERDCSCPDDHNEDFEQGPHLPLCRGVHPNFFHKTTGLAIRWYKHAFRGAYQNQEMVSEGAFHQIYLDCLESLEEDRGRLMPCYHYIREHKTVR